MFGNNKKTDELIKKYNSQLDRRLEQLEEAKKNLEDNNKMGETLDTIRDNLRMYNEWYEVQNKPQQDPDVSPGGLNPGKVQSPEKEGRPGSSASSTEYCDDPSKEGEEFCDPPQKPQARDKGISKLDSVERKPNIVARERLQGAVKDVTREKAVVSHWKNELEERRRLEAVVEENMEQQGLTKPQLQLEALQKERDAAGKNTSDKPGIRDQGDDFVDDLPGQSP